MGRPLKEIDGTQVEKLARMLCSQADIGKLLGCDQKTISNRFSSEYTRGRELGKKHLRRHLWKAVRKGSAPVMLAMAQKYLGFADKVQIETAGEVFDPVAAYSNNPELMQEALELERKAYAASQAVDPGDAGKAGVPGVGVSDSPTEARRVRDGTAVEPDGEQGDRADPGEAREERLQ